MPKQQLPRLEKVQALRPYVLRLEFANGKRFDVDLAEFIRSYKIFNPLVASPELFLNVHLGEWGWDVVFSEEMDISANTLWRLSLEQSGEAMPAVEFRSWRKRHSLSLTGAAQTLGISRRMVAYYDSGERIIPKTVMLACKGAEREYFKAG